VAPSPTVTLLVATAMDDVVAELRIGASFHRASSKVPFDFSITMLLPLDGMPLSVSFNVPVVKVAVEPVSARIVVRSWIAVATGLAELL